MKFIRASNPLLVLWTVSANAQVVYNATTRTLECSNGGRAYCGNYMPLSSNIIIRCYGTRARPANCNDNLAGISPVGVKSSALCFESDSLIGNAACYFNGFVYPDGDNPFRLPSAFGHFVHNSTNGSMITSSTSTMSLNLPTGYGPTMPTASGMHFTPGSGGYNGSSMAGTGAAVPTGTVPPPKPTATFISSAAKTGSVDGLMIVYAVVVGGSSLLVLFML